MVNKDHDNDTTRIHGEADSVDDDSESTAAPILDDLISRAKALLSELEAFRHRLRSLRQEGNVELGHFRGTVQSELNMLERLSNKPESESTHHIARSSNLPFLETVWNAAKGSKDVAALQKRVYTSSTVKSLSQGMRHLRINGSRSKGKEAKENAVLVDAITEGGKTWTKVSLVTNSRLLFDIAKQGWDSGGSDSEYDDDGEDTLFATRDADDDTEDVPLVRTAKELTKAALHFRVRTRTPTVHLILPRIEANRTPEIDSILAACRATGAHLICGPPSPHLPFLPLSTALQNMAPDPFTTFSPTLNIDCTILLALVSEFSHAKVEKAPWFHAALRRQVEIEGNENLLPSLLYPAMGAHPLVCTREAVTRMREIVDTIGTPSERARTRIMLGVDDAAGKSQSELIAEMQQWSAYEVPSTWQLPIRVVDFAPADEEHLPVQAERVSAGMTAINRSVFLHGWAAGQTTITSNRTVVKQLESALEEHFTDLPDEVWPRIWLCPTARSLVGKEKRGAVKSHHAVAKKEEIGVVFEEDHVDHAHTNGVSEGFGKKEGVWPLPEPLRR